MISGICIEEKSTHVFVDGIIKLKEVMLEKYWTILYITSLWTSIIEIRIMH